MCSFTANARSNPAFADLLRSEIRCVKKSEMSGFGNKNVHKFAPIVPIFTHKSRVDFRQQEYIGRLKSTLRTIVT